MNTRALPVFLLLAPTLLLWLAPTPALPEPSSGWTDPDPAVGIPAGGGLPAKDFLALFPAEGGLSPEREEAAGEAKPSEAWNYAGPQGHRPEAAPKGRPLRLYQNRMVKQLIRYYLTRRREVLERGYRRSGRYLPMIRRIFAEEGVPPQLAYLSAVESNFNPRARSPASAVGMWQFTAATGKAFGLRRYPPWYDERMDPESSTRSAARLLGYLYDRFGQWELALAAYNAGEARVRRAMQLSRRRGKSDDFWSLPLPRQTRGFVPSFLAIAEVMENPALYGLEHLERDPPLGAEGLELEFSGTLADIAGRLSLPLDALARLNPAWKGRVIPPFGLGKVVLWVPPGGARRLRASFRATPPQPVRWRVHRIREGESIYRLARRYRVRVREILALNGMSLRSILSIGHPLLLPLPAGGRMAENGPPEESAPERFLPEKSEVPAMAQLHIHTVRDGESFWTISRQYGVRMTDLRRWNAANAISGMIHPSQELVVFLTR